MGMSLGDPSRIYFATLLASILVCLLLLLASPTHGQIFNGDSVVAIPTGANIITTEVIPYFVPTAATTAAPSAASTAPSTADPPKQTITPTAGSTNSTAVVAATNVTTTAASPPPPPVPTVPPPPIIVQPYTTLVAGGSPASAAAPLPLPTTPAIFPQNISTCSTCYGMFPILSRCNVVANSDTFPITANTTYQSLLPFLKCICTFKALDTYPYCIDCLTKTQQLGQLNVLQANHLENYTDAFRQLCGVTYNGNRVPGASEAASGHLRRDTIVSGLLGLVGMLLVSVLPV